jgi:hypothetical protein
MDITFLKSNRFWALIIIAILGVLKAENILDGAIIDIVIATILGFVGIRTVDRFGEKLSA